MNTNEVFLKFRDRNEILNVPLSSILEGEFPANANGDRLKCDGRVYLDSKSDIIDTLKTVVEDCNMALDGSWDKSDDGFMATRLMAEDVIAEVSLELTEQERRFNL